MWPFNKNLEDVLDAKKQIRVHGVKFIIKKIDPSNFLDGSKVMLQIYDTYQVDKTSPMVNDSATLDKIKTHYKDVFMASIVSPKLVRKDSGGLLVDNLFTEWDLAHELYSEIMLHTYGKKKILKLLSQKKSS